ncbi:MULTISPECIES: septal ring lytic transglycosylase RlpA family protein [Bordetella]|uniref:Endolytic peptidoglycan transglycosylase RlpA n=2 Tax=Bordetella TaxID=517 RepID=A0A261VH14_9BORD|nr:MULTISPECIES: septal ring lytic transglycosylase RlpA family protein [Bordetella]MDM9560342.1 septal ring lytic transglycosylase RlpA family protein [Bordetella petrii]OZI72802.1 septal ring lytic transglycosylase RlpA family lipoprotein [Bordetella genomosp. 2]
MTRSRQLFTLLLISLALAVAGCSSPKPRQTAGGGYYQDDGPDANPPAGLENLPDAIPRLEPLASGANRPYTVFGKRYVPDDGEQPYKERGIASWYGKKFHGKRTAIGEVYDMYEMTAAHPTMPLPSYARVTSTINGKTVIVRVNDRGPFHSNRIMDLSYAAARKLGIIKPGKGEVVVERILPEEIRLAQADRQTMTDTAPSPTVLASASPSGLPPEPAGLTMTELGPATPAPAAAPGQVYLQVGAFSEPANAQSLLSRVNQQLGPAAGDPPATVQQTGSLYRVKIGPYADRASALDAVGQVADRIGILPNVVGP